jgi:hypothetical protein
MLNPRARAITKEELTMEKYMTARMISSPFPRVAVATAGGGPMAAALLLAKD